MKIHESSDYRKRDENKALSLDGIFGAHESIKDAILLLLFFIFYVF